MVADIDKVGPLTYRKIFQCDSGSEFKGEITKLQEKHEVRIRRVMTKYIHQTPPPPSANSETKEARTMKLCTVIAYYMFI